MRTEDKPKEEEKEARPSDRPFDREKNKLVKICYTEFVNPFLRFRNLQKDQNGPIVAQKFEIMSKSWKHKMFNRNFKKIDFTNTKNREVILNMFNDLTQNRLTKLGEFEKRIKDAQIKQAKKKEVKVEPIKPSKK